MALVHSHEVPTGLSKLGLIAGQGDFPLLLARAARGHGIEVIAIAITGFAPAEIEQAADKTFWVELGQFGRIIRLLHENNIPAVAMVGRVPHTSVLQYRHFDMVAAKLLATTLNKKADSLLAAVTRKLESENIQVLDSTIFLKSLMPEAGLLTPGRPLTEQETEEIEFGYPIAKAVAGQDIGQTIVVREKMVIAVEGAEGTDDCIRRAGTLAGKGCVVVKVSKPAQDARYDVPVIGRKTIEVMHETGSTALAVSACECLIFDRETVLTLAEEYGIAVVAR